MADYSRPSSSSRGGGSGAYPESSTKGRQDLFENPEAKLRYQVYRCEYQRYEAYR